MSTEKIKDQIISFIKSILDDVTLEDIMYHLYVREKIFRGLKDADEGKIVSNENAKKAIEKWFK
jgi:predicted transcriptional regulator